MAYPIPVGSSAIVAAPGYSNPATTVAWPAGVQAGDLVLLVGKMQGGARTNPPTISGGWTFIAASGISQFRPELYAAWKIYADGDTAPTAHPGSTYNSRWRTVAFRGAEQAVPVEAGRGGEVSVPAGTVTIPSNISTVAETLQVVLVGNNSEAAFTITPNSPLVEVSAEDTSNFGFNISSANGPALAGSVTSKSLVSSVNGGHVYVDLLIRPTSGGGGGDVTAPTFSVAPAVSAIGQTSATVTATINETGSIFWVAVPQSDATPSVAQVIAGQNSAGGAPIDAGSAVGTTTLSEVASGFTAATAYKACFVARDDESTPNVQASVTTVNFTTTATGDTTPPVFTVAPAVSGITQTGGTVTATIDETGSIFYVIVPNAQSTPSVAQVIAGQNAAGGAPVDSGSAINTTALSDAFTGLTASTAYKACVVARDDEGTPNVQASVTVVGFTTAAVVTGTITSGGLKNNAGMPAGVVALTYIDVDNPTTGALVVRKTGVSTNGSSVFSFADAAVVTGTTYRVSWLDENGKFGTAYVVAS